MEQYLTLIFIFVSFASPTQSKLRHVSTFQGLNGADASGDVYQNSEDPTTFLVEDFKLRHPTEKISFEALLSGDHEETKLELLHQRASSFNLSVPIGAAGLLVRDAEEAKGVQLAYAAFMVQEAGSCGEVVRLGRLTTRDKGVEGTVLAIDSSTLSIRGFRPPSQSSPLFIQNYYFKFGLREEFLFSGRKLKKLEKDESVEEEEVSDILLRLPEGVEVEDVSWVSLWDAGGGRSLADLFFEEQDVREVMRSRGEQCSELMSSRKEKYVGMLQTLRHGVAGSLYSVGERIILVKKFHYDGTGENARFVVGLSGSSAEDVSTVSLSESPLQKSRGAELVLTTPEEASLGGDSAEWISVRSEDAVYGYFDLKGGNDLPVASKETLYLSGDGSTPEESASSKKGEPPDLITSSSFVAKEKGSLHPANEEHQVASSSEAFKETTKLAILSVTYFSPDIKVTRRPPLFIPKHETNPQESNKGQTPLVRDGFTVAMRPDVTPKSSLVTIAPKNIKRSTTLDPSPTVDLKVTFRVAEKKEDSKMAEPLKKEKGNSAAESLKNGAITIMTFVQMILNNERLRF